MACPHCIGVDQLFDDSVARKELRRLERKGPPTSTTRLIEALRDHTPDEASLLDVGGGVGAIQRALAEDGVLRITGVDASHAYLEAARRVAEKSGYSERVAYRFGDFVEIADEIEPHDVVTLDRVLCCYPDVDALVSTTAARAQRVWAAVYPKERWWTRAMTALLNLGMWVTRSDYRAYVHAEERIERLVAEHGLRPAAQEQTFLWQVRVWIRPD